MNPRSLALLLALATASATPGAGAVTLSVAPANPLASPGDVISLDVVIGGLGSFAPESLGDFDLDVLYDPFAVSVAGFSLTTLLGDPGAFEADDFSLGDDGAGTLNLSLVSFLTDAELDALQPDAFTLASVQFQVLALAPGATTAIDLLVNALGSATAADLNVGGLTPTGATVTGAGGQVPLPEPVGLVLLLSGLAVMGLVAPGRGSGRP